MPRTANNAGAQVLDVQPLDAGSFRAALGSFPTGVALVTALDAGQPVGALVESFGAVSIEPPLVSVVLDRGCPALASLSSATDLVVNVLADSQEWLVRHFSSVQPDRFAAVPWRSTPAGAPVIEGVAGAIECRRVRVLEIEGQHIIVGSVLGAELNREVVPLLAFQRGLGSFTPGALVTADHDQVLDSMHLVTIARPELEYLARSLGAECSLQVLADDDIVFAASANESGRNGRSLVGSRVPMMPPFGALFLGGRRGMSDEEWLSRAPEADGRRQLARQQLARVRARGYSVGLFGADSLDTLDDIVQLYSSPDRSPEQEQDFLDALGRTNVHHDPSDEELAHGGQLLHVAAPIRDLKGSVIGVLRLGELPYAQDLSDIEIWAAMLRESILQIEMQSTRSL